MYRRLTAGEDAAGWRVYRGDGHPSCRSGLFAPEQLDDLLVGGTAREHGARPGREGLHGCAAREGELERLGEVEHAPDVTRGNLTQGVAEYGRWSKAMLRGEDAIDPDGECNQGGLAEGGCLDGGGVAVEKDVLEGCPSPVSHAGEQPGAARHVGAKRRRRCAQPLPHPDILRPLPGEDDGDARRVGWREGGRGLERGCVERR